MGPFSREPVIFFFFYGPHIHGILSNNRPLSACIPLHHSSIFLFRTISFFLSLPTSFSVHLLTRVRSSELTLHSPPITGSERGIAAESTRHYPPPTIPPSLWPSALHQSGNRHPMMYSPQYLAPIRPLPPARSGCSTFSIPKAWRIPAHPIRPHFLCLADSLPHFANILSFIYFLANAYYILILIAIDTLNK